MKGRRAGGQTHLVNRGSHAKGKKTQRKNGRRKNRQGFLLKPDTATMQNEKKVEQKEKASRSTAGTVTAVGVT